MPAWSDEVVETVAARMVAGGLAPWLRVTTKEQQAQALAETAATDAFNFGPPDGVLQSTRLASAIARQLDIEDIALDS